MAAHCKMGVRCGRVAMTPRAVAWSEEIELCPDALYLELTGKSVVPC